MGRLVIDQPAPTVLAHRLALAGSAVVAVHNFSSYPSTVTLTGVLEPDDTVEDLFGGEPVTQDGELELSLAGYGFRWLLVRFAPLRRVVECSGSYPRRRRGGCLEVMGSRPTIALWDVGTKIARRVASLGIFTVDDTPWVARGHSREQTFRQDLVDRIEIENAARELLTQVLEDVMADGRPVVGGCEGDGAGRQDRAGHTPTRSGW